MLQVPPPLQPGDLLKVIAPSGCLQNWESIEAGIEVWQQQGYRVERTPGCGDRWGYLAGSDDSRRAQLVEAWQDSQCKGILCARGGYGGARLLERWPWHPQHPKWLIGFSDITSLLWRLYAQGIASIHGPLLATLPAEPSWSQQRLFDWLQGKPLDPIYGDAWHGGVAAGSLLPANLTVATHLLGTPVQPPLDGTILALEDTAEAPYRIDRMLTQWRMLGVFQKVRGIALGRFSRCHASSKYPSFTVEEVLRDRLGSLDIPVVANLPFGHDGANAALPVGSWVRLDGDRGCLFFEENKKDSSFGKLE
jgi:muramoyltetrapeptide carboxypeptidase